VALNLVGEVIIKAAAGWLLIFLGFGVTGVMLGFAIGAAVSFLHSLWIVRPARIWEGAGWLDRKVLADTLPLFAGLVGIAIQLNLDVLGLKLLAPQNTGDILAGYYQAAVILARTPVFIAQALALVLFSYAAGGNKWQELNLASQAEHRTDYVRTAIKTWLRLIVPGVMVLILAPQLILDLFFPDAYQSAADILGVSAAGCSMLALATLLSGVFQALGKRKIIARSAGIATTIQVLLLIWLVPLRGAMGAALSLVGAGLAFLAGLFPLLQPILREMAKQNSGPGKLTTWLVSQILPHILLTLVLIWTPRVLSDFAWVTLCCAGIVYLGSLAALRPRENDTVKPTALQAINHFVQVLLGG
jgi:O-antigen/teichoic acid export membrane protein